MAGPKGVACKDYATYTWSLAGQEAGWTDEICANTCNVDPACVEVFKFLGSFGHGCLTLKNAECDTYIVSELGNVWGP
jgi:hypothetical protein